MIPRCIGIPLPIIIACDTAIQSVPLRVRMHAQPKHAQHIHVHTCAYPC